MSGLGFRASWRIARRDLHAGFRGLRLLFLCLLLGVATLATIGSLTASVTSELSRRGQTILGGDIEVEMTQRRMTEAERAHLESLGELSETISLRAMAQAAGRTPILGELKGVDAAYPLYGALTTTNGPAPALRADEILIGAALAERTGLGTGDGLRFGEANFTVRGVIAEEPDRVGEGFTLGPVSIVSMAGLERTRLVQPGSLYESKYRVRLPEGSDPRATVEALEKRYPASGWEYKDRDRAAPGASRFIERMGQFLSLIGLAGLVIAGIGVSNGVSSYLAQKRSGIATFKVLGASSADIARIYMMQVGAVAGMAILAGLTIGAALPALLLSLMGDVLPVKAGAGLHPLPLATSAAYGALIAFIFTLPPLARARLLPAAAIYRSQIAINRRIDRRTALWVFGAAMLVITLALVTARDSLFSAAVLGGIGVILLLLLGIGHGLTRLALRLPRPRAPLLRLALANLHRPGSQTPALVVALGLALTLFTLIAAIQTSLAGEIDRTVPKTAPNQFVLDIPIAERSRFIDIVEATAPGARLNIVPALRGTITAYGSTRVADLPEIPEGAWFLRGERGLTYSADLPEGSSLVAGRWWPHDYAGPPLVSLDAEAAEVLGIGVGDTLTISVLGREIDARIASLRKIDWGTMGFNYVMVVSPNMLRSAPHNLTATITMDPSREDAMMRALLNAFPGVSVISIGDVIDQVGGLLDQMSQAILLASLVTVLAGIAVLVGAIAAARQSRTYDSVILKALGATRGQILGVQLLEYGTLALLLALIALLLGTIAAWYIVTGIFDFGWAPDWGRIAITLAIGAVGTLGISLAGTLPLISVRPAQTLRQV